MPSHGGFDGGCVADDGTCEKNINLALSLRLDAVLAGMGYKTLLVRDSDRSVETDGETTRQKKRSDIMYRYSLMKSHPDCVYLCIHQNKYSEEYCHGAQVFYTPANDGAKSLADKVQSNIISLVQHDNTRMIKPCTDDVYIIHNAPDTACAVLIECGFLSNAGDLANLKTADYQDKISLAIAGGLAEWLSSENQN